jgi:hypothetical protein
MQNAFSGASITNLTIPDSVTTICAGLYSSIANLTLPSTPYSIISSKVSNSYGGYTSITTITFNSSGTVNNLENAQYISAAIKNYPGETLVIGADYISTISECSKLKTITFTSADLEISSDTASTAGLYSCSSLTDITFLGTSAPSMSIATSKFMYSAPSGLTIHIPTGTADAYTKWFKTLYYGSTSTTIADAIESGTINLAEDAAAASV